MQREPAVAGQFYPGRPDALRTMMQALMPTQRQVQPAVGIVSPHAGYVYSGAIAGQVFARVKVPSRVVILGPNHRGVGPAASLFAAGRWKTPLGDSAIDEDLAAAIVKQCPDIVADEVAHRSEHSLEVQLPFVQALAPEARIVPLCLGHLSLTQLLGLGQALGRILSPLGDDVLIVASSDMTHYEPGEVAREKDMDALEHVLELDPEGLYRTVVDRRISMCGVMPTVVMLAAAREMGATTTEMIAYGNSGDVTGDQSSVVGYAGVVVRRQGGEG